MNTPTPWQLDAAVEAALIAWLTALRAPIDAAMRPAATAAMRAAILAALPHLGIAELIKEAADCISAVDGMVIRENEDGTVGCPLDLASRLREMAGKLSEKP